jgi:xanthine phosphoribosyltransferase
MRSTCLTAAALLSAQSSAFIAPLLYRQHIRTTRSTTRSSTSSTSSSLHAKRKKRDELSAEDGSWYDDVGENASPEEVFWQEMERRRLISQSGVGPSLVDSEADGGGMSPIDMVGKMDDTAKRIVSRSSSSSPASMASTIASQSYTEDDYLGPGSSNAMSMKNPGVTVAEERTAEATLASYAAFAVEDNYLYDDEDEDEMMKAAGLLRNDPSLWQGEDPTLEEENAELDKQLDEWERELMGDGVDGSVVGGSSPFFDATLSDEPWDRYGNSDGPDNETSFKKELERKMRMVAKNAKELTLEYEDDHPEEAAMDAAQEEEEYVKSLSSIAITSPRLENAAVNPKAEAFFKRPPDELQGFDTMWVAAIDEPCIQNLYGIFSNYGIQFADNFGDWEDGTEEDSHRSIEDIASYKARKVFQVTGLPCIASRTSFEVEPIKPEDMMDKSESRVPGPGGKKGKNQNQTKSPRVVTGYRFNDIGEHVDRVVQALLPFSEPTRVTRFRSCVCFYDGEIEIFEYGELDCDLYFSGSARTFIPMSSAINSMLKSCELALDLQYQKWLFSKVNTATGGYSSDAGIKLRDRVLKEAKVLPNDIIDVSSFMDAFVDVDLMDQCGKDLAERFVKVKPSKILTVATTGLVIAIPMAKYLQVPLVYARKQRSVVMADTFDAGYNSKTIGQDRQLIVSKDHLDEEDRVLIVDDFLSSGSSQEALLRIISEAGATAVGVGVLLEKEYEAGRVSLSGYEVPVESVVRIVSVSEGVIQLHEEVYM